MYKFLTPETNASPVFDCDKMSVNVCEAFTYVILFSTHM